MLLSYRIYPVNVPSNCRRQDQEKQKDMPYQHPPGPSRRSNTLITSKTFSLASASTVIAPEGPAPMTATRFALLAGMILRLSPENFLGCSRSTRKSVSLCLSHTHSLSLSLSLSNGCGALTRKNKLLARSQKFRDIAQKLIHSLTARLFILTQSDPDNFIL